MIYQRHLIKEIADNKFHSAVMTAFSINLYYWESQWLRALSGKGINFVSAIVDADCLSEQLQRFCLAFTGKRKVEFSLHGYRSKGAFHPKIQFYVGNDAVCILIGSGNLTLSGHGKNMEVWTPVHVESKQDATYPFMREVWNYLKGLYSNLGEEAKNIVWALEHNCTLLQDTYTSTGTEYNLDNSTSIRLFADGEQTLFAQCQDWIGEEKIKEITVMSPFYDSDAVFIKSLHDVYNPERINIIVEKGFGAPPKPNKIPNYVNIYLWDKVGKLKEQSYQKYFHAKCIFIYGENYFYMICGSANASVAAFGTPFAASSNHEISVGFKSSVTDYFAETGFELREKAEANEVVQTDIDSSKKAKPHLSIWIKEASYDDNKYSLLIDSDNDQQDVMLCFGIGNRPMIETKEHHILASEPRIDGMFSSVFNPLYVEIKDKSGNVISNRQFMIPTVSMIQNDPSPENVEYRRRCHDIESGEFISGQVLLFIERVMLDAEGKMTSSNKNVKRAEKKIETQESHVFSSINDYLKDDGNGITGGIRERQNSRAAMHSTMLFDSIMSYISKSAAAKAEEKNDEEETEDIRLSEGKANLSVPQYKPKKIDDTRQRVIRMFEKYMQNLPSSVKPIDKNANKPHFEDVLKRFMAAIYFINRALGYRFKIEGSSNEKQSLLDIPFHNYAHQTATEYFYRIVAMFSHYVTIGDFKEEENQIKAERMIRNKQDAFELCLAVAAICDWQNEGNNDYDEISQYCKLPVLKDLHKALNATCDNLTQGKVIRLIDKSLQDLDGFETSHIESIIANNISLISNANANLRWEPKFNCHIMLERKNDNPNMAFPHTMLYEYNNAKKRFCPEYMYLYDRQQLLKTVKSK